MSAKAVIAAGFLAAALAGCVPAGDRLAGSSTEAGNAGGKLSLAGGGPAAGIEVALVSRSFRSDTAPIPAEGDRAGAYYRTRTGPDGRFAFDGVVPGDYRIMALDGGAGATADSVAVRPGPDTAFIERVLKPLGGIRGVAKVIDSAAASPVWVVCKATLKPRRLADTAGAFRLDSLPEGEYDLEPFCPSCQAPSKPYRVRVGAGRDTLLADTLKLYPGYFQAFPPADSFTVRPASLPFRIGGKTHYGERDALRPLSARWTWDGNEVEAREAATGNGEIQETQILIDSSFFAGKASGLLRLELRYPDTTAFRQWRIACDPSPWTWTMRLARAEAVGKLIGGDKAWWRFRILEAEVPAPGDVAFWGLSPSDSGRIPAPGSEIELMVESRDQIGLEAGAGFTFVLVPDSLYGGRVFRPRRDERLADFAAIRLFDRARLGVADSLEPHMLPDGLRLDRYRGAGFQQRYLISRNGKITESLVLPASPEAAPRGLPGPDSILLFYRRAPAGSSFAWNDPVRGAEKAWVADLRGRAWALDSAGAYARADLPAAALEELRGLLAPMAGDPPGLRDDAALPEGRAPAYAWFGGRGRMGDAGSDTLLAPLAGWLERAGLAPVPAFALPDAAPFRFLSFKSDASGFHYTGDTLILARDSSAPDLYREYLSLGSPGRAADSSARSFTLRIEGDSLIARAEPAFASALFGKLGKRTPLFKLSDMAPAQPAVLFDLPALASGNALGGVWEGEHALGSRVLSSPAFKLVPKAASMGARDAGYLYTAEGGLEAQWRLAADGSSAEGWDKLPEPPAKEGLYDETPRQP